MRFTRRQFLAGVAGSVGGAAATAASDSSTETYLNLTIKNGRSAEAGETIVLGSRVLDDARNEYDRVQQKFVPDESGRYYVETQVEYYPQQVGDRLVVLWRDVTDGINGDESETKLETGISAAGEAFHYLYQGRHVELTAGNEYEWRVRNADSELRVSGGASDTYLQVERDPL
jgi:hypothetical protein